MGTLSNRLVVRTVLVSIRSRQSEGHISEIPKRCLSNLIRVIVVCLLDQ